MFSKFFDWLLVVRKHFMFMSVLLFTPIFLSSPSAKRLLLYTLVICYYLFCFYLPVRFLGWSVKNMDFDSKVAKIFSWGSVFFMYIYSVRCWIFVLLRQKGAFDVYSGLFLIPLFSFGRVMVVVCLFVAMFFMWKLMREKLKKS